MTLGALGAEATVVPRTVWATHRSAINASYRILGEELRMRKFADPRRDWDQEWFAGDLVPRLKQEGFPGHAPMLWMTSCAFGLDCFRAVVRRQLAAARRQREASRAPADVATWAVGLGGALAALALWRDR